MSTIDKNVLGLISTTLDLPKSEEIRITPTIGLTGTKEIFDITIVGEKLPSEVDDISVDASVNVAFDLSNITFQTGIYKGTQNFVRIQGLELKRRLLKQLEQLPSIDMKMLLWDKGMPVHFSSCLFGVNRTQLYCFVPREGDA